MLRWTENRNIEAFLDLVAEKRINVERLISHQFPVENAERAYQLIAGDLEEPYLGVLLRYDTQSEAKRRIEITERATAVRRSEKSVQLGLIGAGDYVRTMLLPHFKVGWRRLSRSGNCFRSFRP